MGQANRGRNEPGTCHGRVERSAVRHYGKPDQARNRHGKEIVPVAPFNRGVCGVLPGQLGTARRGLQAIVSSTPETKSQQSTRFAKFGGNTKGHRVGVAKIEPSAYLDGLNGWLVATVTLESNRKARQWAVFKFFKNRGFMQQGNYLQMLRDREQVGSIPLFSAKSHLCDVCGERRIAKGVSHSKCSRERQRAYRAKNAPVQ